MTHSKNIRMHIVLTLALILMILLLTMGAIKGAEASGTSSCHIISQSQHCPPQGVLVPLQKHSLSATQPQEHCHIISMSQHCPTNLQGAILNWKHQGSGTTPWFNTPDSWRLIVNCVGTGTATLSLVDMQKPVATLHVLCSGRPEFIFSFSDRLYIHVVQPSGNEIALTVSAL